MLKSREVLQAHTAFESARTMLLSEPVAKLHLNIVRIMNKITRNKVAAACWTVDSDRAARPGRA